MATERKEFKTAADSDAKHSNFSLHKITIPFIHPKIHLMDIDQNGNLTGDNCFEWSCDGVKFIVYNFSIGEGSFGEVFIAQKDTDKTWYVLKVQRPEHDWEKEAIVREFNFLLEEDHKTYFRTDRKGKHFICMKLIPGEALDNFLKNKNNSMPTVDWMRLASNTAQSINNLHKQRKIMHRDIKPANLIRKRDGTVAVIDFGMALDISKGDDYQQFAGNIPYMAPEAYSKRHSHSKKSDTYSTGMTIAHSLGLAGDRRLHPRKSRNKKTKKVMVTESDFYYVNNHKIPNETIRKEVLDHLKGATDAAPEKRFTLDDSIRFFDELSKKLPDPAKLRTIGILDVREYENATEAEKANLIRALKVHDEVCFVDINRRPPRHINDYITLSRRLSKQGVLVGSNLYFYDNSQNLAHTIAAIPRAELPNNASIDIYFHVSTKTLLAKDQTDLKKERVASLKVSSGRWDTTDYGLAVKNSLYETCVTDRHAEIVTRDLDYVITMLDEEMKRLNKKYGIHQKMGEESKDSIALTRYRKIAKTKKYIRREMSKGTLTYGTLKKELESLQSHMTAIKGFFARLFLYHSTSTGSANIEAIRRRIHQERLQKINSENSELARFEVRSRRR